MLRPSQVIRHQGRLQMLGFALPMYGVDGRVGEETLRAMSAALDELEARRRGHWPAPKPTSLALAAQHLRDAASLLEAE